MTGTCYTTHLPIHSSLLIIMSAKYFFQFSYEIVPYYISWRIVACMIYCTYPVQQNTKLQNCFKFCNCDLVFTKTHHASVELTLQSLTVLVCRSKIRRLLKYSYNIEIESTYHSKLRLFNSNCILSRIK